MYGNYDEIDLILEGFYIILPILYLLSIILHITTIASCIAIQSYAELMHGRRNVIFRILVFAYIVIYSSLLGGLFGFCLGVFSPITIPIMVGFTAYHFLLRINH